MIIGYLGDIVFTTSKSLVRTIDGFGRSGSGRWAAHEVIGDKPLLEFLGAGLEEISFEMLFNSSLGVDPETELAALRELRDSGEAVPLVLNGTMVTDNYWVVESLSETVLYWARGGSVQVARVSVTLREYDTRRDTA